MFMSRGTRKPPRGTAPHAPGAWVAGGVLSVVMLVATGAAFAVIAVLVTRSLTDPGTDMHGYVRIFGTVFLIFLVVPLLLTIVSTILLLRRKRAGFIVLAVAGCPFAFAMMTLTGIGAMLGLAGVVVMAVAITAFVMTDRPATASIPPAMGPPPGAGPSSGAGPPPTG